MKRHLVTVGVVLLVVAGITAFNVYFEQPRATEAQDKAAEETKASLDDLKESLTKVAADAEAKAAGEAAGDGGEVVVEEGPAWPEEAPETFKVKFITTKGDVVIETHKKWAPLGAERFFALAKSGYYTGCRFFRVVTQPKPFVVQFGIAADPAETKKWIDAKLQDDPVTKSNVRGTISYAAGGKNTRTTQIFINIGDNTNLDGMGFAPFAEVIEGMDVVAKFNAEYGDDPTSAQSSMVREGNTFLDRYFEGLDEIKGTVYVP